MALDLHSAAVGSGEYGCRERLEEDVRALRHVRDNWRPTGYPPAKRFDDAVLELVNAALALGEKLR
jgi:hypothetical protein